MSTVEERLDNLARVVERGFDTLADLQRDTNERLDGAIVRLDRHEEILSSVVVRLDRHEDALVQLADGLLALNGKVDTLTDEVRGLGSRMDNFVAGAHQEDHVALRRRVERLERHLGFPSEQ